METVIYIDTHIAVWLFAGLTERFKASAERHLEDNNLRASAMVLLELQYLHEIGRLKVSGQEVVEDLQTRVGLTIPDTPLPVIARAASKLSWTRDPFDRLIAGESISTGIPLLTKDETIREHFDLAIWD